jgi:hypothetical protein
VCFLGDILSLVWVLNWKVMLFSSLWEYVFVVGDVT